MRPSNVTSLKYHALRREFGFDKDAREEEVVDDTVGVGIRHIAQMHKVWKSEDWIAARADAVRAVLADLHEAAEKPVSLNLPASLSDDDRKAIEAAVHDYLVGRIVDFRGAFLARLVELLGPPA